MTQVDKLILNRVRISNPTSQSVRGGRMVKTSRGIMSFAPAVVAGGIILLSGTATATAETCVPHDGEPQGYELCDLGLLPQTQVDEFAFSKSFGVSGDGSVVAGVSTDFSLRATRWTSQGGLENLGVLDGDRSSEARGISVDGLVLVGYSRSNSSRRAFSWTREGGIRALSSDVYSDVMAVDANFDGTVIVGVAKGASGLQDVAVRWDNGVFQALGALGSFNRSEATAVDSSGQVVVGYATNGNTAATDAFRWNPTDGMRSLGITDYTNSRAYGVSADGSIIVGDMVVGLGGRTAFRWTSEGAVPLARLQGYIASSAFAISGDGKVIVGRSDDGQFNPNASTAVLWKETGEVVSLGRLTGSNTSEAWGVNSDGTVVVGFSNVLETSITAYEWYNPRAFIWRAAGGGDGTIQDFTNLMASFPAIASETDLAFGAQQAGVDSLMDSRSLARGAGKSFVSMFGGVSNTGSGDDTGGSSASLGGISYGYGLTDQLTLGFSVSANGTDVSSSGIDLDNGFGAAAWGVYSENGANRTGLQGSFALGYLNQEAAMTRGFGVVDVEAASGNAGITTRSARLELGYGFDHSSGWVLTPTAAITHYSSTRGAYAENPEATAFSAAYDQLETSNTIGTLGMTGDWQLADDRRLSLGAGADLDLDRDTVTLAGSANIPGMEIFAVDSPLSRNDIRPYATASYSVDVANGGTFTASVRAGRAIYGDKPEMGVGLRYAVNF